MRIGHAKLDEYVAKAYEETRRWLNDHPFTGDASRADPDDEHAVGNA
jgi:hypothetical protein